MNEMPQDPITDELLSAYIDGDVTEAEQRQVEYAIANDPDVAWQVETLRQTVALLRNLPAVPFTRSFVIEEEQVADVLAIRRNQNAGGATAIESATPWQSLLRFLNGGNLLLRNASAVAAALFLVVSMGRLALVGPSFAPMVSAPEMTTMQGAASDAAPAPASSTAMEVPALQTPATETPALTESEAEARTMVLESVPIDASEENDGVVVADSSAAAAVVGQDQNADETRKTVEPERVDENAALARQADAPSDTSVANSEDTSITLFAPALENATAPVQDETTETSAADFSVTEAVTEETVVEESGDVAVAEARVMETEALDTAYDAAPTVPAISIPVLPNPFQWLRPVQPATSAPASDGEAAAASAAPAQAASETAASAEAVPLVVESETPTVAPTPVETPTSTPSSTHTAAATAVTELSTPTPAVVAFSDAEGEPIASTEQSQAEDRSAPAASTRANEADFWSIMQLAALGGAVLFFVLWLLSRTRHKSLNRTNRA